MRILSAIGEGGNGGRKREKFISAVCTKFRLSDEKILLKGDELIQLSKDFVVICTLYIYV